MNLLVYLRCVHHEDTKVTKGSGRNPHSFVIRGRHILLMMPPCQAMSAVGVLFTLRDRKRFLARSELRRRIGIVCDGL